MDSETLKRKLSGNGKSSKKLKTLVLQQTQSSCHIPDEIIINILSRLPGSSLTRFTILCKQWLTLIRTDPVLKIKYHSPTIIVHTHMHKVNNTLTLIDTAGGPNYRVMKIGEDYDWMSPPCNGLICMYSSSHVMLYNPATQQELLLPTPTKGGNYLTECYLGYHPITKEYKVVRLFYVRKFDFETPQYEVHTIGSGTWRRITFSFDLGDVKNTGGVCINGSLYWKAKDTWVNNSNRKIVSFDLNNEKFEIIETPWSASADICSIAKFNGHLCVRLIIKYLSASTASTEVWSLASIATGWIRISTANVSKDVDALLKQRMAPEMYGRLNPIFIQGKILVQEGEDLHYLDLETGVNFGKIYQSKFIYDAQFLVESLLNVQNL